MAETTTYSIELIVEDGSSVASANSYVSLEYVDTYCVNHGYSDWLTQDEYVRKSAVIKAMDYIDSLFPWKGRKMYRNQSLSFPRVDISDDDGFDRTGEIPDQLKKAVCEAAFYAYNQTTLYGKRDPNGPFAKQRIRSRKKADVVEIEEETEEEPKFYSAGEIQIDWTSAYQSLDSMLKGLYVPKNAASHVCIPAVWRD